MRSQKTRSLGFRRPTGSGTKRSDRESETDTTKREQSQTQPWKPEETQSSVNSPHLHTPRERVKQLWFLFSITSPSPNTSVTISQHLNPQSLPPEPGPSPFLSPPSPPFQSAHYLTTQPALSPFPIFGTERDYSPTLTCGGYSSPHRVDPIS